MVNAELARPPLANITATYYRVMDHIEADVSLQNLTGTNLSTLNGASVGIIVYEDIDVGLTNRYARGSVSKSVTLFSGSTGNYHLVTSDIGAVNWDKLHVVAYAEYNPGYNPDPTLITTPYDMLQAAFATQVPNIGLRQSSIDLTVTQLSPSTAAPVDMTANIDTVGGPGGALWTVGVGLPDWLSVTPSVGPINSSTQVKVIGSKLQVGLNTATVSFTLNGTVKTASVPVNVTFGSPQLTISPGSLENLLPNQDLPSGKVATLQMSGNFVNLPWEIFTKPAWVTLTPGSGFVGTSANVSIDPNGIQVTNNSGIITLKAHTSKETVYKDVKISYDPPDPVLLVQPDSILLFNDPANPKDQVQTIQINGSPTNSFWSSWAASSDADWMTVIPSGSVGTPTTLFVNASKLKPGANIGHITLSAKKYNRTVTKTVLVTVLNQAKQSLFLPIILR